MATAEEVKQNLAKFAAKQKMLNAQAEAKEGKQLAIKNAQDKAKATFASKGAGSPGAGKSPKGPGYAVYGPGWTGGRPRDVRKSPKSKPSQAQTKLNAGKGK